MGQGLQGREASGLRGSERKKGVAGGDGGGGYLGGPLSIVAPKGWSVQMLKRTPGKMQAVNCNTGPGTISRSLNLWVMEEEKEAL